MKTTLTWKKNWWSSHFKIFADEEQVGMFISETFAITSVGELNLNRYRFDTKGFFKPKTTIVDRNDQSIIGEISYNGWSTKAIVSMGEVKFIWKHQNFWPMKYRLYRSRSPIIHYSSSAKGGQIQSEVDDDLLLLSGLHIASYYEQVYLWSLVIPLIFFPGLGVLSWLFN